MPQKDKIELYRSITAPETLKERVLALEENKRKGNTGFKTFAAAAAAVAVIAVSAFGYFGYTDIEVSNEVVQNAPTPARILACETVELDVDVNFKTTITVSDGVISAYYPGKDEFEQQGSGLTVDDDAVLTWNLESDSVNNGTARIELRTLGRTKTYILETNEAGYTLRLEK